MSKYDIALQNFEKALKIRKKIGDKDLIKSTQFAIKLTKEKIKITE